MRVKVSGGSGVSQRGTFRINNGALKIIGNWEGNTNAVPTGTILQGYLWRASSATTTLLGPDGGIVPAGNFILALVDNPGPDISDTSKWAILNGIGI